MTVQTAHSDIFDVIGQQAGATGISAQVEILRGVELLRAACARVGLYSAVGVLAETDQDHTNCTGGIDRAMPSMHASLNLLTGTQAIPGLDPVALKWVRGIAAELPESCDAMRRFVAVVDDLEARHHARTNDMAVLREFTRFAATEFNDHFGKIINRMSADLQDARTRQKHSTDTTGTAARAALKEIGDVSRNVGLVAINASIEAAHVGDRGKGFAIIASEIREMSEQIEKANRQVQAQVDALIRVIEQS